MVDGKAALTSWELQNALPGTHVRVSTFLFRAALQGPEKTHEVYLLIWASGFTLKHLFLNLTSYPNPPQTLICLTFSTLVVVTVANLLLTSIRFVGCLSLRTRN